MPTPVSREQELCRSISSGEVRFCELPISGLIGVIDVELDRSDSVSEHVAVAYDYGRRGYSDDAYEGDWNTVKSFIEREFPEAPWVRIGLDNPWPGSEGNAPNALLAWSHDGITVGEFARHYAVSYPKEMKSHLASKVIDAVSSFKDELAGTPERSFRKLLEEWRARSGWQGLSADQAVQGFARFCADEISTDPSILRKGADPSVLRVRTDLGDLVASFSGDPGIYDGIVIDLEKPDGTSGQVAIVETVPADEVSDGIYGSRLHTLAWDGNDEDSPILTEADPCGEAMSYPPRDPASIPPPDPSNVLDPKGRIVLMTFDIPGHDRPDALIFQPGSRSPFIAASLYDPSTGEWSQGRYFSDPSDAYYHANPEILEESAVVWRREDFSAALQNVGIDPTPRNVSDLINETFSMRGWKDSSIERGNDLIADEAYCAASQEEAELDQVRTESLDSSERQSAPGPFLPFGDDAR